MLRLEVVDDYKEIILQKYYGICIQEIIGRDSTYKICVSLSKRFCSMKEGGRYNGFLVEKLMVIDGCQERNIQCFVKVWFWYIYYNLVVVKYQVCMGSINLI